MPSLFFFVFFFFPSVNSQTGLAFFPTSIAIFPDFFYVPVAGTEDRSPSPSPTFFRDPNCFFFLLHDEFLAQSPPNPSPHSSARRASSHFGIAPHLVFFFSSERLSHIFVLTACRFFAVLAVRADRLSPDRPDGLFPPLKGISAKKFFYSLHCIPLGPTWTGLWRLSSVFPHPCSTCPHPPFPFEVPPNPLNGCFSPQITDFLSFALKPSRKTPKRRPNTFAQPDPPSISP